MSVSKHIKQTKSLSLVGFVRYCPTLPCKCGGGEEGIMSFVFLLLRPLFRFDLFKKETKKGSAAREKVKGGNGSPSQ